MTHIAGRPEQVSCEAFYKHLPSIEAQEARAAKLARKAYRFAKRNGMTTFIEPPSIGVGARALRCKPPARDVEVRAMSQYVIYHPHEKCEGWMVRVDVFGFRSGT